LKLPAAPPSGIFTSPQQAGCRESSTSRGFMIYFGFGSRFDVQGSMFDVHSCPYVLIS
jgi:hypothetical protein